MKIILLVPSYAGLTDEGGKPRCPGFLKSLADTLALGEGRGHQIMFAGWYGDCYIQNARNELLWQAEQTDAEVFFFLDDDVEWNPEDVLRLATMPDPVVAAAYPKKQTPEDYPVVVRTDARGIALTRADGCIPATEVPAGFLAIKRTAIEALKAALPWRSYAIYQNGEKAGERYDFFPQGIADGRWWGEDFAFCRLWRSICGDIWLVPDVTLTHHGRGQSFTGNYFQFLCRQPGGSHDPEKASHDVSQEAVSHG